MDNTAPIIDNTITSYSDLVKRLKEWTKAQDKEYTDKGNSAPASTYTSHLNKLASFVHTLGKAGMFMTYEDIGGVLYRSGAMVTINPTISIDNLGEDGKINAKDIRPVHDNPSLKLALNRARLPKEIYRVITTLEGWKEPEYTTIEKLRKGEVVDEKEVTHVEDLILKVMSYKGQAGKMGKIDTTKKELEEARKLDIPSSYKGKTIAEYRELVKLCITDKTIDPYAVGIAPTVSKQVIKSAPVMELF